MIGGSAVETKDRVEKAIDGLVERQVDEAFRVERAYVSLVIEITPPIEIRDEEGPQEERLKRTIEKVITSTALPRALQQAGISSSRVEVQKLELRGEYR